MNDHHVDYGLALIEFFFEPDLSDVYQPWSLEEVVLVWSVHTKLEECVELWCAGDGEDVEWVEAVGAGIDFQHDSMVPPLAHSCSRAEMFFVGEKASRTAIEARRTVHSAAGIVKARQIFQRF